MSLAVVAAIALAARVGIQLAGADYCRGPCRTLIPFDTIAKELRGAGFRGNGTIVVRGIHLAGNLRVQFPHARIMEIGYPPETWPRPSGNAQCLAAWTQEGDAARNDVDAYLTRELGVDRNAPHRDGTVSTLMQGSRTRAYRLYYRLYDGPQGECR
jgi:hypothetical protein